MGLIRFLVSILAAALVTRAVEGALRRNRPKRTRPRRTETKRQAAAPIRSDQVIDVPYEDVS